MGALLLCSGIGAHAQTRVDRLAEAVAAIDREHPGNLGLYAEHLASGDRVGYESARRWYLASTVKLPLAIAVLQAAREGRLSLDDEMVLQQSHYVDGEGELLWAEPGARYTVESLIGHSIENSDSTATDWLMNHLGVEAFNERIRADMVAEGLGPFTTILQVRYDAYGELHPDAEKLSNMDFVRFRSAGESDVRVSEFKRKLGLRDQELGTPTLEKAFARYYQRELNSGTLEAFAELLKKLVQGELLDAADTARVLRHARNISTGDERIRVGLPDGVPFAQKTGTQIERACNVGIIFPQTQARTVVVAACTEGFGDIENAEAQFQRLGRAMTDSGWVTAPD